MKTLVLGPTRTLTVDLPVDAVIARLGAWLDAEVCPFAGHHRGPHFELSFRPEARRLWSPVLTVEVRVAPNAGPSLGPEGVAPEGPAAAGAEIFGRFNPSHGIWTGYMLGSLSLVTIIVGALVWAFAEFTLGRPPHALWAVPVCVVVLGVMWSLSAAGQRLAAGEMDALWAALAEPLATTPVDSDASTPVPGFAPAPMG